MRERFDFIFLAFGLALTVGHLFPREEYEREFFTAMIKFNWKVNNGSEFLDRLEIFASNYDFIMTNSLGNCSVALAIGQYAHMDLKEFHEHTRIGSTLLPLDFDDADEDYTFWPLLRRFSRYFFSHSARIHQKPAAGTALESSVDWVVNGAVGPVQDQGGFGCGSCWAFSTTGAIEGAHYIKYGHIPSLSEQQLVSCDTGNDGCNGGWMGKAFRFAKYNGGLTTDGQYPYLSGSTGISGLCDTQVTNVATAAPLYSTYVAKSVSALQSAVMIQPVSIAVDASSRTFQHYAGGVITCDCGTSLNHAMLLVGYGELDGIPYWKVTGVQSVKNSWGASWGDNGYVLIERSDANVCGVLSAAIYPTL